MCKYAHFSGSSFFSVLSRLPLTPSKIQIKGCYLKAQKEAIPAAMMREVPNTGDTVDVMIT